MVDPLPPSVRAALALLDRRQRSPVTLLAIDGYSAAGKSSFARLLHQVRPQSTVVHTDDFYRPLPMPDRARLDAADGYLHYYDWQRLEAQVLHPLSHGRVARYQRYDWLTNQLAEWTTVQPDGLVIVEGCYAARPELRPYFQVIVFVTTPAIRRRQRQQARADAPAEWLERWDAAERYYMEHIRPHAYADLMVAGA
jgi:uridine kinase